MFLRQGWQMLIPNEDKLILFHAISPSGILFRGGSRFWFLIKIGWCYYTMQHIVQRGWQILIPKFPNEDKLMLSPHSTYLSDRGGRCWFLISEDKLVLFSPFDILFRGGGRFWPLMKISLLYVLTPCDILFRGVGRCDSYNEDMLMLIPQSTYCSDWLHDKTRQKRCSSWWANVRAGRN